MTPWTNREIAEAAVEESCGVDDDWMDYFSVSIFGYPAGRWKREGQAKLAATDLRRALCDLLDRRDEELGRRVTVDGRVVQA